MAIGLNNVKLSLRTDELSNWLSANPILLNGEAAVVRKEDGSIRLKIGNGLKYFSQLDYVDSDKIIGGAYASQLHKILLLSIITISNEDYDRIIDLGTYLSDALYIISSDVLDVRSRRIVNVNDPYNSTDAVNKQYLDRSLSNIDLGEYYKKSETSSAAQLSVKFNKLSSITNEWKTSVELSISEISSAVSSFSNEWKTSVDISVAGISSAVSDLETTLTNDYWKKTETSSAVELSNKFNGLSSFSNEWKSSVDLSIGSISSTIQNDYWKKTETSSAIEISSELKKYQLTGDYALKSSVNEVKVKIDNKIKIGSYNLDLTSVGTLSIIHISEDDYLELIGLSALNMSAMYIVSSDHLNAYEKTIVNVANPVLGTDAANKNFIENKLSGYYLKTETSSAAQISVKFNSISSITDTWKTSVELSIGGISSAISNLKTNLDGNYWKKTETSSAVELSNKFNGLSSFSNEWKSSVDSSITDLNDNKIDIVTGKANELVKLNSNGQLESIDKQLSDFVLSSDVISYPDESTSPVQSKGIKDFVNSSIINMAAYYITKDISGNAFKTYAELTTLVSGYNAGKIRIPIRNDYAIVLADESHRDTTLSVNPTTRYTFLGTYLSSGAWQFQYVVNNSTYTQELINAINSGIDKDKVALILTNATNITNLTTNLENNYWKKSLTSSATEITTKFGNYYDKTLVNSISSYLSGKIPVVNDGRLTIQRNGTTLTSFSANSLFNTTVDIEAVTGIKMNGSSIGLTSGTVDLGTVLTAHLSLTAYEPISDLTANYYKNTSTSSSVLLLEEFEKYETITDLTSNYYKKTDTTLNSNGTIKIGPTLITALTAHLSLTAYEPISDLTSNYYKKSLTSSDAQLQTKFNTLSTYSQIHNQLSNDGYLTAVNLLSDYYLKTETSSKYEISTAFNYLSNQIWELSDYVDGFEKAVYGENKNRYFIEISPINPETINSNELLNIYLNDLMNQIGSSTTLSNDSTILDQISAVNEVYDNLGELHYQISSSLGIFDAVNNIANVTPTPNTFLAGMPLFGGEARTNMSMKQYVLNLNKKIGLVKTLANLKADLSSLSGYYLKSETSSASELSNEFKKYELTSDLTSNYYKKIDTTLNSNGQITIGNTTITALTAHLSLTSCVHINDLTLNYYTKQAADAKISSDISSSYKSYIITEDMVSVTKDATKGVAPYNVSYGYTNITISSGYGIEWKEGALYFFVVDTKMVVASAYRNVRVRIGESGAWIPLFGDTAILAGSSYMIKGLSYAYFFKSTYQATGALHKASDANTNTTYDYLVNTVPAGDTKIDSTGYGARYSITFATTALSVADERYSSLVTSSSTAGTKSYVTPASGKFYIDRKPLYIYTENIVANGTNTATLYHDFARYDIRYTSNVLTSYVSKNQKVFLWLKNFNIDDYSFLNGASDITIVSRDKISTSFPSSTSGYEYFYLLGLNSATYYQIYPVYGYECRIYQYNRSNGELITIDEAKKRIAGILVSAIASDMISSVILVDDNGHLIVKSSSTNQVRYVDMYRQNLNISVLLDATFNDVGYVNPGTLFVLPTAISGHVRDFAMIMSLTGTTEIPSFSFPLVSSDLEPWSDPIPEWELSTTYRITFTETRNNKWEIHSASVKIT